MVADWVKEELVSLQLGDERRVERAMKIVDLLAEIGESQPDVAKSKAALKANYRFVANPKNSPGHNHHRPDQAESPSPRCRALGK